MSSAAHILTECLQAAEGCWRKILWSGWYYCKLVFTWLSWVSLRLYWMFKYATPSYLLQTSLLFQGHIAFHFTEKTSFQMFTLQQKCVISTHIWLIKRKIRLKQRIKDTDLLHILFLYVERTFIYNFWISGQGFYLEWPCGSLFLIVFFVEA